MKPLVDRTSRSQTGETMRASADESPQRLPHIVERMELLEQKDHGPSASSPAAANKLDKALPWSRREGDAGYDGNSN